MPEPDIIKKKKKGKKRRSARVYVNANKPLAVPLDEIAEHFPADPDDDDGPTPQHTEARSRTRAMARPDTGKGTMTDPRFPDGDPMNVPGPRELAFRHQDLRQSATRPVPLLSMRTDADMFPRDLSGMSIGIPVALARLDAAAATGLASAPGNPASRRMDHIASGSATGPNGGHGLADPQSHAVALKASDRVEVMRQAMYGDRAR